MAEPPAEPILTHQELLELESLDALVALCRERGVEGDREQVLLRAQMEWGRVALEQAKTVEAPDRFEPVVCTRGGVTYSIFGVYHGLIGGADPEYKAFVDAPLRELELTLFENALSYFYPAKRSANIPDFVVLGILGSLRMGLQVGLLYPRLLWEGFWEVMARVFKVGGNRGGEGVEAFEFSTRYHAVDPETRRGLDEVPLLPSRLQIEYEMTEWDRRGWHAAWSDAFAVVPRSMFMAGFAEGYATSRSLSEVALVVGDLHTAEIQRFLEADTEHPLFRRAQAFGRRSDGSRLVTALLWKVMHLSLAGLGGCVVIIPTVALLWYLLVRAGLV